MEENNQINPSNPKKFSAVAAVMVILVLSLAALYLYRGKAGKVLPQNSQPQPQNAGGALNQENTAVQAPPKPAGEPNNQQMPRLLFYSGHSLKEWQNGQYFTVADFSKEQENIYGVAISPSFSDVLFGHFNYDRDGAGAGLYSSGINTLSLAGLSQPFSSKTVGPEKNTAKWDLRWSPDSKYVAYVVNDGTEFDILDVTQNKIIQAIKGSETSPAAWIGNDKFSFVQDHVLYLGTVENPKEKVVAKGVYNSLCSFEGPPFLVAPNWSKDFRYVGYYVKSGYSLKDTQTGKTFAAEVGSPQPDEAGGCGDYTDIRPVGFDNQSSFYFLTNQGQKTMRISLPSGSQEKFENLYAGPGMQVQQISPDGAYMVYTQADSGGRTTRSSINNAGTNGEIVCHNSFALPTGTYADSQSSWSKRYPGVVALRTNLLKGYIMTLFDAAHCQILGKVIIDEEYGDSGMSFAGME